MNQIMRCLLFGLVACSQIPLCEQAIGAEGASLVSSPQTGCVGLLSVRKPQFSTSISSPQISSAESLLSLISIALTSGAEWERDFPSHLKSAMESPVPVNPFLNLKSFQAQVLAQRAEPLIDTIQDSEWPWIQDQVRAMFAVKGEEAFDRAQAAQQTSIVNGYKFVSDSQMSQALDGRDSFSHGPPRFTFIGTFGELHLFVAQPTAPGVYYGLVAISRSWGSEGPTIKWLIRAKIDQKPLLTETELSLSDMTRIWALDGKLYAVVTNAESETLVRVDPATGNILSRVQFPGKGLFKIWGLRDGQVVAANFGRVIPLVGRTIALGLYRFDPPSEKFVKTSFDLSSWRLSELTWEDRSFGSLLILDQHSQYATDGERIFVRTADRHTQIARILSGDHMYKWSTLENAGVFPGSPEVHGNHILIELTAEFQEISSEDANRKVGSSVGPFDVAGLIRIPIQPFVNHAKRPFQVSPLTGTDLNIVVLSPKGLPERGWLINRKTLGFVELKMPGPPLTDFMPEQWGAHGTGMYFDSESKGRHSLTIRHQQGRKSARWIINSETSEVLPPVVSDLPGGAFEFYSKEDPEYVAGQVGDGGIWIRQDVQIERRGTE